MTQSNISIPRRTPSTRSSGLPTPWVADGGICELGDAPECGAYLLSAHRQPNHRRQRGRQANLYQTFHRDIGEYLAALLNDAKSAFLLPSKRSRLRFANATTSIGKAFSAHSPSLPDAAYCIHQKIITISEPDHYWISIDFFGSRKIGSPLIGLRKCTPCSVITHRISPRLKTRKPAGIVVGPFHCIKSLRVAIPAQISLTGAATGGKVLPRIICAPGRFYFFRRHAFDRTVSTHRHKSRRFHFTPRSNADDRDARDHRWYLTQISLSLLRQKNSPTFNDSLRNDSIANNKFPKASSAPPV